MANKIDLIVKYSTDAFDEVYAAESRSALLDGNKKLMQFTGVKTVKIAKFSATGLYDYARANDGITGNFAGGAATDFAAGKGYGYAQGDMGITWEEFTLNCDRAAQYRVELFDNEESAQLAVGQGTTEINRTVVIPEIDAYCFSKIASYASATLGNLESSDTIGDSNVPPIAALNKGLAYFDEQEVPPEDQIIFCSPKFLQALRNTAANGLVKPLLQGEFSKVKFTIEEYEGRKIIMVPPRRFMTDVNLFNGGYGPKSSSAAIDFMIVAKSAVYHIVKYNKIKVFGPDVVQDYDGYKVNARVYHDVFVPDNKKVAIYVKTGGFTSNPASDAKVLVSGQVAGTAQYDAVFGGLAVLPGSIKVDSYCISGTSSPLGTAKSSLTTPTDITIGEDIDVHTTSGLSNGSTGYVYAIANGVVVAKVTITVVAKTGA